MIKLFGRPSVETTEPSANSFTRALRRMAPTAPATPAGIDAHAAAHAVDVLSAALDTIRDITDKIGQMAEVAATALATPDIGERGLLAERYEDLRAAVAKDVLNGDASLLRPDASPINVPMPGNASYVVAPIQIDPDAAAYSLPLPTSAFADNAELTTILNAIDRVLERLDRAVATFENDRRYLKRRLPPIDQQKAS